MADSSLENYISVNRGIGLEFLKKLSSKEENVIYATVRLNEKAEEVKQLGFKNVRVIVVDMSDPIEVFEDGFKVIDYVDVVIHNAGVVNNNTNGPSTEQLIEDYTRLYNVNAIGAVKVYRAIRPYLFKVAGLKRFVAVSSMAATISAMDLNFNGYGMSKAALNFFVKQVALEHSRDQDPIKQNSVTFSIAPGLVATDMAKVSGTDPNLIDPKHWVSVEDSVSQMINVIRNAKPETHNGGFYNFNGEAIPY